MNTQNKSHYFLKELADHLHAKLIGDPHCLINSIAPLDKADKGQISFLHDVKYKQYLASTKASAVIVAPKWAEASTPNLLIVDNPYLAYAKVAALFDNKPRAKQGIHPSVIIGKNCNIAETASIGANCVIGDEVVIGDNTVIHPGTVIGEKCTIGNHCILWSHVTLYYGIKIGNGVIIHSGAVIGADGFGMAKDKGKWHKIPQLGSVVIGDDVEVGANTTIDRGALEDTIIEEGVKLDNQIQVAHNVQIGAHTVIAGCSAIAGSAKIGKNCMFGGGVAINGHIEIADSVVLTALATVPSSITKPGIYSSGTGLQEFAKWRKNIVRFQQLDELAQRLKKLENKQDEN